VFSTDLKVAAVAHVMDIEDGPCLAGEEEEEEDLFVFNGCSQKSAP